MPLLLSWLFALFFPVVLGPDVAAGVARLVAGLVVGAGVTGADHLRVLNLDCLHRRLLIYFLVHCLLCFLSKEYRSLGVFYVGLASP